MFIILIQPGSLITLSWELYHKHCRYMFCPQGLKGVIWWSGRQMLAFLSLFTALNFGILTSQQTKGQKQSNCHCVQLLSLEPLCNTFSFDWLLRLSSSEYFGKNSDSPCSRINRYNTVP